jgi:hypothetical protein
LEREENVRVVPRGRVEFSDADDSVREASVESLNSLLGRVSETSRREIDNLIDELQMLRGKIQSDTDRIKRDIAKHAAVSEHVLQLTKIVSESVQNLPNAPGISP